MKEFIKIGLLLCFPLLLQAQVNLVVNNATLKVSTGVDLRVEDGSISNKNSGNIVNDGNIYLDRNFDQTTSATYTGGIASWIWFEGPTSQSATGDAAITLAKLRVDNGNLLVLGNTVNVSNRVDFMNNTKIQLGPNNLVLAPGATITGYNANNFVITNSTGILQQEVGAANVVFPVGSMAGSYNPATLVNAGVQDNFRVRVFQQVFQQGTTGTPITTNAVDRTWMIEEEVVGGSDVTVTLQWTDPADELSLFDRSFSGIARHLSGTTWDNPTTYSPATSLGTNLWSQSRGGFNSFSPFIVRDLDMALPIELLSFRATRQNPNEVLLTWATESELNNKGFYVERMLESETAFSSIAWVDGHGSSSEIIHYDLTDANAYTKMSYYRLRQIDYDESESFSEIRAVRGSNRNPFTTVDVYPVPARNELNIRFGILPTGVESGNIRIFDLRGRLLFESNRQLASNQILTIDAISDWAPATYLLQIQLDNGSSLSHKFVKVK